MASVRVLAELLASSVTMWNRANATMPTARTTKAISASIRENPESDFAVVLVPMAVSA